MPHAAAALPQIAVFYSIAYNRGAKSASGRCRGSLVADFSIIPPSHAYYALLKPAAVMSRPKATARSSARRAPPTGNRQDADTQNHACLWAGREALLRHRRSGAAADAARRRAVDQRLERRSLVRRTRPAFGVHSCVTRTESIEYYGHALHDMQCTLEL